MNSGPACIFLLGPTAAGKTALALALARVLDAEIVSVDSGLVYRGLDIGTAKPTADELAAVPHHLVDVAEPMDVYSVARFVADALEVIDAIRSRGRRPLLVGGTMLYFNALQHGLAELPAADEALRRSFVDDAALRGWQALHADLARIDPAAAERIHPNDAQRVQRALEVHRLTGRSLSELQRDTRPALDEPVMKLALVPESRAWLHARIERRLDAMVAAGFLEEVRRLRATPGVNDALPAMRSVGYRQAAEHLEALASGTVPGFDWRARALAATRRLAKRQLTWLRGMNDNVCLPCDTLEPGALHAAALAAVTAFEDRRRDIRSGFGIRPCTVVPPVKFAPPDPAVAMKAPAIAPLVEQIGRTRLVPIDRIGANPRGNRIYGKLEGDNPAGSVKDRPAANMILKAVERGDLGPGDLIIEATSGNTGIALAMVAAALGYRLRLLMPDNMTQERKATMLAYGAELVLVTKEQGMEFARDEATAMAARGEGLLLDQFANPDNWGSHYATTGPEIWEATEGLVTHFVSSMGTTGTIMGVSRYLKERNPLIEIIGVQPADGSSIPGIRRWPEAYLPKIYEPSRVDRILDVSAADSEEMARRMAREEGILAGVSAGGSLLAATRLLPELESAIIVTVVCDRGDRYLSSGLFPTS